MDPRAPHDKGIDESLAALIGEVRVGEAEAPQRLFV
jgi:hypothetical protein